MRTYQPARTTAQLEADAQAARKQGEAARGPDSLLVDRRASTSANLALQTKMQGGRAVQRQAEEEEELQMKAKEPVQRQAEEEEELQMKAKEPVQRQAEEEEELQMKAKEPAQKKQANETGLPDNLKAGIENLSGMAMDHVKVHYNSGKPAQLNAHAYAQGSEIHIAPGQEKHLPHEAWHVVQQSQGRVQPTMQMAGVEVNDDKGLEHEADVMGEKALKQAP